MATPRKDPPRTGIPAWTFYGTGFAENETVLRHVVFSNVVYLTLPLVYLIFMLIDYKSAFDPDLLFKFDRIVFFAIVGLCIFFLHLNKSGYIALSRTLFLISWILLLHIIPIIIHNTPTDYYIAYPLGIIFHSFLIHLCFSAHKEPWKFWSYLVLNAALMLTAKRFLIAFDQTPESTNVLRTDPFFTLDIILYWLLINLLSFYFFYVFEHYINRLTQAREVILQQQAELVSKNAELQNALNDVRSINLQVEDLNRNLEKKVAQRTQELQEKNEKLVQYAFMNAHILRGPLCRIKGLFMLRKLVPENNAEQEKINAMISITIDELDKASAQIQDIVSIQEDRDLKPKNEREHE